MAMKQPFLSNFLAVTALAVLLVLCVNFLLFAKEQSSGTITVIATVAPNRYIIVDSDLTIQTILSNTEEEVRPMVLLDTIDGQELPYSEGIMEQYQSLKPSLNFSEPGIVYDRDERPIQALIKRIWRTVGRWFSGQF